MFGRIIPRILASETFNRCPHCNEYMEDVMLVAEPITYKQHIEQGCSKLSSIDQLELNLCGKEKENNSLYHHIRKIFSRK